MNDPRRDQNKKHIHATWLWIVIAFAFLIFTFYVWNFDYIGKADENSTLLEKYLRPLVFLVPSAGWEWRLMVGSMAGGVLGIATQMLYFRTRYLFYDPKSLQNYIAPLLFGMIIGFLMGQALRTDLSRVIFGIDITNKNIVSLGIALSGFVCIFINIIYSAIETTITSKLSSMLSKLEK